MSVQHVSSDWAPVVIEAKVTVTVQNEDAEPVPDIGVLLAAVLGEVASAGDLIVDACARVGASVEVASEVQNQLRVTNTVVKQEEE